MRRLGHSTGVHLTSSIPRPRSGCRRSWKRPLLPCNLVPGQQLGDITLIQPFRSTSRQHLLSQHIANALSAAPRGVQIDITEVGIPEAREFGVPSIPKFARLIASAQQFHGLPIVIDTSTRLASTISSESTKAERQITASVHLGRPRPRYLASESLLQWELAAGPRLVNEGGADEGVLNQLQALLGGDDAHLLGAGAPVAFPGRSLESGP